MATTGFLTGRWFVVRHSHGRQCLAQAPLALLPFCSRVFHDAAVTGQSPPDLSRADVVQLLRIIMPTADATKSVW
jgi:hypothetical protein